MPKANDLEVIKKRGRVFLSLNNNNDELINIP